MEEKKTKEIDFEWWMKKFDINETGEDKKQVFAISFYNGTELIGTDDTSELSYGYMDGISYDFIQMKKKTGKWPTRCTIKLIADGEK